MAKLPALQYIRGQISEGIGPTGALANYRSDAHANDLTGIRDSDFFTLYGEIRASRDQVAQAMDAPKDVPGGGLTPTQWGTRGGEGYVHWVQAYQIERETGGLIVSPFIVKSTDILTPEEAEQRALAFLDTQPDNYNRRTLGVSFTGLATLYDNTPQYE